LLEALAQAGHEADDCLGTDVALAVAEKHGSDVVIFCESVSETGGVARRDALKALAARYRVVLLAAKTNELVPYAAALGVKDFVFTPAAPAAVLHRLENPATGEEAAESLAGVTLPHPPAPGLQAPAGETEPLPPGGRRLRLPAIRLPSLKRRGAGEAEPDGEDAGKPLPARPAGEQPPPAVLVAALGDGDTANPALALAGELARRHGVCVLVDADARGDLTALLGLGGECSWAGENARPRLLPDGVAAWSWPPGPWHAGKDEALRRVLRLSAGGPLVVSAGRADGWTALVAAQYADVALWVTAPGASLAPCGGPPGLAVTAGDARAARRVAAEAGIPCVTLPVDAATLCDALLAVRDGAVPAGAARPPRLRLAAVAAALGRAARGTREAARAAAGAAGLALRLAELTFWVAVLAVLGAGAVWAAGWVAQVLGADGGALARAADWVAALAGTLIRRW